MADDRRKDRQGILILVACAAVLALGFGLGAILEQSTPKLDPMTLQAIDRPSTGTVCVLLDRTDPLGRAQQGHLEERLRELVLHRLRPNDLLEVWELGSTDEGSLRRLYSRYFPGRDANPLWGNPDRVAARCDSLFWSPLLAVLRSPPSHARADRSPIMSGTRELSEQADFARPTPRHEVMLVSDLLENSSAACFYRYRPDFKRFRASSVFPTVRADLRGAVANVFYLTRPDETPATSEQVRNFWRAYFMASGAAVVRFERL